MAPQSWWEWWVGGFKKWSMIPVLDSLEIQKTKVWRFQNSVKINRICLLPHTHTKQTNKKSGYLTKAFFRLDFLTGWIGKMAVGMERLSFSKGLECCFFFFPPVGYKPGNFAVYTIYNSNLLKPKQFFWQSLHFQYTLPFRICKERALRLVSRQGLVFQQRELRAGSDVPEFVEESFFLLPAFYI